jgi:pimeloyl-ACP methyl ester carboxylesterase
VQSPGGYRPAPAPSHSTVIAGGPHAIIWTHAEEVNQALLDFIDHPGPARGQQNGRAG